MAKGKPFKEPRKPRKIDLRAILERIKKRFREKFPKRYKK